MVWIRFRTWIQIGTENFPKSEPKPQNIVTVPHNTLQERSPLPKAVAREVHMMTSGERRMAEGMARPRAAAKLPQNGIRICIQPKMLDLIPDQIIADPQP
jgi:hypothetical protein